MQAGSQRRQQWFNFAIRTELKCITIPPYSGSIRTNKISNLKYSVTRCRHLACTVNNKKRKAADKLYFIIFAVIYRIAPKTFMARRGLIELYYIVQAGM
ncbi:MAG: hypothetical protein BGP14_15715 [Sphingobacteriales bacterium 44-15]|nr:MAG: hypothetical protein BGP14_15715 [Sphingobacteriales bacterium 44-15]